MSTTERPELHHLCGLDDVPSNGTRWHEVITAGLPARGVRATALAIGVADTDLAELLGISEDVLNSEESLLLRDPSNFLHRIALAFTRTVVKTAGDVDAAALWLRTAQPNLKGYVPILLLQSHVGAEYVFVAIERMDVPLGRVIRVEEAPDAGTAEFEHNVVDSDENDGKSFGRAPANSDY